MSTVQEQPPVKSETDPNFVAYELHGTGDMPIRSATLERDWMDRSRDRFAYRCLPLTIANQAGWVIENPTTFTAVWDGGQNDFNVRLRFGETAGPPGVPPSGTVITVVAGVPGLNPEGPNGRDPRISSHFGSGVVTISIPYLFRTPSGVNLWVKGPSNWVKDGAHPLEGIVETDWSPAPFTMNWKLTRPNYPVRFERSEPICMVVPVPRGFIEALQPGLAPIGSRPELNRHYEEWYRARADFLAGCRIGAPDAVRAGWQRHYTKGEMPGGVIASDHQTRLRLKEFDANRGCSGA